MMKKDRTIPFAPDYVVIGHVTSDLQSNGAALPGGTAAYAALTARAAGFSPALVTSLGASGVPSELESFSVVRVPAEGSTTFENRYAEGIRTQRLVSRARQIGLQHVPADWLDTTVLHLGPVANEFDHTLALLSRRPSLRCLGVTPQGWMRRWDDNGWIKRARWTGFLELSRSVDALVFSDEDVGNDSGRERELIQTFPIVVVTRGKKGSSLYVDGSEQNDIEAASVQVLDPTGAGDIFATLFFCLLARRFTPLQAARISTRLATESVEHRGLRGIPTPARVKQVVGEHSDGS